MSVRELRVHIILPVQVLGCWGRSFIPLTDAFRVTPLIDRYTCAHRYFSFSCFLCQIVPQLSPEGSGIWFKDDSLRRTLGGGGGISGHGAIIEVYDMLRTMGLLFVLSAPYIRYGFYRGDKHNVAVV